MLHPTLSAIRHEAWKIIDSYDLRHEDHMLQVKFEHTDCQDGADKGETLISIIYKRPNAATPTARALDHYYPNTALLQFDTEVRKAAYKPNCVAAGS